MTNPKNLLNMICTEAFENNQNVEGNMSEEMTKDHIDEVLVKLFFSDNAAWVVATKLREERDALAAQVEALTQVRESLAARIFEARTLLQFFADNKFWVCDDEWTSREPDQDDEREWVDYTGWAGTLLANPDPESILAALKARIRRETLEPMIPLIDRLLLNIQAIGHREDISEVCYEWCPKCRLLELRKMAERK